MQKKKIFITINSMEFGGIQKSLLSFLSFIRDRAEVDLLIWDDKRELPVPDWVNVLPIRTIQSVKTAMRKKGIFSRDTALALFAAVRSRRWTAVRAPGTEYDTAIAYSQVGVGKYYVIDRVRAKRKYAFYHNGAYTFGESIRALDREYYPRYTSVIAVSEHIKQMLHRELSGQIPITVVHNLLDTEAVLGQGRESCPEMAEGEGVKILTVGRLSAEKNPMIILGICEELQRRQVKFQWYLLGDGVLRSEMEQKILDRKLEEACILCGNQLNPYRFMSRCDVYVQLSKYEAEPVTIQEVAVFGKPLVLSRIEGFKRYAGIFENIALVGQDVVQIVNQILLQWGKKADYMDKIHMLQEPDKKTLNKLLFGE